MAENLFFDNSTSKEDRYEYLIKLLPELIIAENNFISNLANLAAVLKEAFENFSWVGFYLDDGKRLYLGPFQGKLACTNIEYGKGVCGTAYSNKSTVIVEDVEQYAGHIACDSMSKSEIVIPIMNDRDAIGVLDIDSYQYNTFDNTDKLYLEKICTLINKKVYTKMK